MKMQGLPTMKRQQGAALAVGLILLLIITLMGYAGMKGTMLQEKMAAGLHNRSLAHAGANSAIRAGEAFLYNLVQETNGVNVRGTTNGSFRGIYSQLQDREDATSGLNSTVTAFKERNWTSTAGTNHNHNFSTASNNGSLNAIPQYIIEEVAATGGGGAGGGPNSQEFGTGSSGAAGSATSEQRAFLITGKSQSGDGRTIQLLQSLYTVVVSSAPTN